MLGGGGIWYKDMDSERGRNYAAPPEVLHAGWNTGGLPTALLFEFLSLHP